MTFPVKERAKGLPLFFPLSCGVALRLWIVTLANKEHHMTIANTRFVDELCAQALALALLAALTFPLWH